MSLGAAGVFLLEPFHLAWPQALRFGGFSNRRAAGVAVALIAPSAEHQKRTHSRAWHWLCLAAKKRWTKTYTPAGVSARHMPR